MYSYVHRFVKEEYRSLSQLVIVKKAHHHIILHRKQNGIDHNRKESRIEKKKPLLKKFVLTFHLNRFLCNILRQWRKSSYQSQKHRKNQQL